MFYETQAADRLLIEYKDDGSCCVTISGTDIAIRIENVKSILSHWPPAKRPLAKMQDIVSADVAEFTFDDTGKLWLNVDGKCALRIGKVEEIVIDPPITGAKYVFKYPYVDKFAEFKKKKYQRMAAELPIEKREGERRQSANDHFAGSDRRMGERRE